MLRRWARFMVAFATAFAAWAIATPARAAAPICDPHAATGVAPAPQLQFPTTSLDAAPSDDCGELLGITPAAGGGRAPEPAPPSASQDSLVSTVAPRVSPAPLAAFVGRDSATGSACAGARSRVDRPPKA
jgi:hypothetical protein